MSYYGKGTHEEIMTNLGTVCLAITGIKFVDYQRVYDAGINYERCPGVFINHIRTDKKKILKNVFRNEMSIAIVGWVWAAEGTSLGTILNTFIEQVKTAIITDPTRGSKAYTTEPQYVQTDGGSIHPQGQFIAIFDVVYFSVN